MLAFWARAKPGNYSLLPKFPLWFPRDVVFRLLRVVWSCCSCSAGSSVLSIVLLLLPGASRSRISCVMSCGALTFQLQA